jgi:hypothetical protein
MPLIANIDDEIEQSMRSMAGLIYHMIERAGDIEPSARSSIPSTILST